MLTVIPNEIAAYCTEHSSPASAHAKNIEHATHTGVKMAQQLSGAWEGALLKLLVGAIDARRILEIGLFTGYSALTMAEALPPDGTVISCELDRDTAQTAQQLIHASAHAHKIDIRVGPALETIRTLSGPFDIIFLDADKENYCAYFDAVLPLLRTNGLIIADNVLWSGKVLNPKDNSDHALVAFNATVRHDSRVECAMLPLRDGVSLIRKIV